MALWNEVQLIPGQQTSYIRPPTAKNPFLKRKTLMNLRLQSAVFSTIVLFGAITGLSGCATTGMDRATKTTNSMQTVERDYKTASAQIDATNASLEELVKLDQTDLKKAYVAYAENVKKMEKSGNQLNMHTEKMSANGNEYFAEWESSYTNPEIRELSERRRIEMKEIFVKIPEASIGVKGALKSYMTDIREIEMYLSNDLTSQGIETIRPVARRAVMDGDSLNASVKPVLAAIDSVKYEMPNGTK
jgi:hypothetical protein